MAVPAHAQQDSVDGWVEGFLREREVPGLALAILEKGRIIKARGYGLANVEHGVPVKSETVFQSASVGKQFTAAVILLLAQDGRLALDASITDYLHSAPSAWRGITVRHLLSHTSGIPDYEQDTTWLDYRRDYTEDDLLRIFARLPLLFRAGEEWSYSNTGYILLGMVIRAVTGEYWGDVLRKRVLEPLGMQTARVISEADIVPNRAAGYRLEDGVLKNQDWVSPSLNTTADGSLYLTVLDLAKWDAALNGNALLSDSTKRLMWSPVRLNDGSPVSHGLGWFLMDEPKRRAVESDGAWQGFRSYIGRFLDDSVTVIVLANSSAMDPMQVGHTVAALYRPTVAPAQRTPIRLTARALEAYVGEYRLPTGEVLRVSRTENGLRVDGDIPLGPVLPESANRFFGEGWKEASVAFVRDHRGEVRWLQLKRYPSSPSRAHKVR